MKNNSINWKRGFFRIWFIATAIWCAGVFLHYFGANTKQISWFSIQEDVTIHVKFSDTETWNYPANWGYDRIRDDIKKRVATSKVAEQKWAAEVPEKRKAECRNISNSMPFKEQPEDCVKLFFSSFGELVEPTGWETQIEALQSSGWTILAAALPFAAIPPIALFVFGALLIWIGRGFRRNTL
jgi:hypothetical protein